MLYLFYGTDLEMSRKKATVLVNSLRAKKPDADFEEINSENWNTYLLESHLGGQGLFSNKYIVYVNRVTDSEQALEEIKDFIPAMNESANIFIVLEGKLNAELKKTFLKSSEKIVESEASVKENKFFAKGEFNIFALADALGSRDRMKAWMIYREAVEKGNEPESILGTLFWQAKSMILAGNAGSVNETGLNPFVYGKSKRYAANYSSEERKNLLTDILKLYHDGHRGMVDLEIGIEMLLLKS